MIELSMEETLQVEFEMQKQIAEWIVDENFTEALQDKLNNRPIYPLGNGEYIRIVPLCDAKVVEDFLDHPKEETEKVVDLMNLFLPERIYTEILFDQVYLKEIFANLWEVGRSGNGDKIGALLLEDVAPHVDL